MFIGEVIGTVIATHKTSNMAGLPLRIVRQVNADTTATSRYVIAVDGIGADTGELVLVTSGSAARQTKETDNRPVDAIIMAVVDTWQTNKQVQYDKGTSEVVS